MDSGCRRVETLFITDDLGQTSLFLSLSDPQSLYTISGSGHIVCIGLQAFRGRGKKYQLFWPEKAEFIRMAAKFGATVVPFAGVGSEDALTILLDQNDIRQIPVIGQRALQNAERNVPQARRWEPRFGELSIRQHMPFLFFLTEE